MSKGEFSLSFTGGFILMLVATAIGALLITTISGGGGPSTEDTIQQVVQNANTPICKNYKAGQEITMRDFKTIVYARHLGKCEKTSNVINLQFRLSNTTLEQIATELGITFESGEPYIIYSDRCKRLRSINGVLVGREEGYFLFNQTENIRIDTLGSTVRVCSCIDLPPAAC